MSVEAPQSASSEPQSETESEALAAEPEVESAAAPEDEAGSEPTPEANGKKKGAKPADAPPAAEVKKKKRRRRKTTRVLLPAWGVSAAIHLVILGALAAATLTAPAALKAVNLDSALVSNPGGEDELLKVYAEPSDGPRDQAVGGGGAGGGGSEGGGGGTFGGIGTGAPTATPSVGNGGGTNVNEKTGLPGVGKIGISSGLSLATLAAPGMDLGAGGGIKGDVTAGTKDIGEALDQVAREILRHLEQHKLTVVWLFDESGSMKDDQKTIRRKFDRVSSELKVNVDAVAAKGATGKKKERDTGAPLTHAIVGFGKEIHYEIKKPTANIDLIGQAIERLKVDDTGVENTMHAVADVIDTYSKIIGKERKLLIVLVTDESGDDGAYVEEARQAAMSRGVAIYVIGRQSLFGYDRVLIRYIDPITKDEFWPAIRRGPETADLEVLQWDGLTDRRDEYPAGFAPYELARLAKDTGGMYFLLPTEESMRISQREKAYSITAMKELVPDYESRTEYVAKRNSSDLRKAMFGIIQATKGYSFPLGFPVVPAEMVPAATEARAVATARLNGLLEFQKLLERLKSARDRETDKRWQANYDLLLAQIVAYQVKAFEYRACVDELLAKRPKPKNMPIPDKLNVWWQLGHSREPKAPKSDTAKKYAEAEKLFKDVIERYPKTPWADMAQEELNRGFSVGRWEASSGPPSPTRAAREKFVPKF